MKPIVVTTSNKDRFKETISGDKPVLMLYYASWCGHCKALHPTWEALKKKLEVQNGILVGEVEYSNMQALPASLQNIRGFPTIQVLQKGRVKTEYQGDRQLDSLFQFAMRNSPVSMPKKTATKKLVAKVAKPVAKPSASKPKKSSASK